MRSMQCLVFGLPTLGFYLETAFNEGNYSEASALLITFYILIAQFVIGLAKLIVLFDFCALLLGGGRYSSR